MTHRVRQMGHVLIETPRLEECAADAVDLLGLKVTRRTADEISLSSNARHAELTYRRAPDSAVAMIGLEAVDREALASALEAARRAGVRIVQERPSAPGAEAGFVVEGPSGHRYELHLPVPRSEPADYPTGGIRPRRLDHVNITVPDARREFEMLHAVFGMEMSDRSDGDEFIFVRAGDLFHHTLAVVAGDTGLHHISFEANHAHDLIRLADALAARGRAVLWGPGHHGANANSYFTYHADPIGCIIEYSFGMTRIDNETLYTPGIWPMAPAPGEEWLNLWGAPPPGMFGKAGIPVAKSSILGVAA